MRAAVVYLDINSCTNCSIYQQVILLAYCSLLIVNVTIDDINDAPRMLSFEYVALNEELWAYPNTVTTDIEAPAPLGYLTCQDEDIEQTLSYSISYV